MHKKYDYKSIAAQFKLIFVVWVGLLLLFISIFSNEKNPLLSEMVPVFSLLLFGVLLSIPTYIRLKRTYIEITDDGIRFNGLRKKIFSPWQGVREIKILGRKHKIYTASGNFSIGYLKPADDPGKGLIGIIKDEGKYSQELIEDIKKHAPQAKLTLSILMRPL